MMTTTCQCGSPMSYFEEENYQKCGACHQKETEEKRIKEQEEIKRKQEERKAQEQREKEKKEAEQRSIIEETLKKAVGKTIREVSVTQWTDAMGEEARVALLRFTDDTSLEFAQEEYADGCRGSYDYYHYLAIEFND